jgi:hypothetical protein
MVAALSGPMPWNASGRRGRGEDGLGDVLVDGDEFGGEQPVHGGVGASDSWLIASIVVAS